VVRHSVDDDGGPRIGDHLGYSVAKERGEVHGKEGVVDEGVVHGIEGFGEVEEEGGVGGRGVVDEVVDEDVGVDTSFWDVSCLEGVDEVGEDGFEADSKGGGEDFVWGVEEGDGADVVKG